MSWLGEAPYQKGKHNYRPDSLRIAVYKPGVFDSHTPCTIKRYATVRNNYIRIEGEPRDNDINRAIEARYPRRSGSLLDNRIMTISYKR
jgi:hypothetical protein